MEEKKSYYAIIPANVRYDKDLPPNAKLLYGEITALCNEKGYCWAKNNYFAELYGVSKTSISKWIKALIDKGYIKSSIVYKEGSKEIDYRYLTIVNSPIEEKLNTPLTKVNSPIEEKLKDNNTVNTTSNNTSKYKERKKTGYDEILSQIENESLRECYLEYIKMRKMIKAPMTDRALTMLINEVNKLEPDNVERQKQMLNKSIMNNWKSVYPLKDGNKQEKKFAYDNSYDEGDSL